MRMGEGYKKVWFPSNDESLRSQDYNFDVSIFYS
jgi:hypothetical protein